MAVNIVFASSHESLEGDCLKTETTGITGDAVRAVAPLAALRALTDHNFLASVEKAVAQNISVGQERIQQTVAVRAISEVMHLLQDEFNELLDEIAQLPRIYTAIAACSASNEEFELGATIHHLETPLGAGSVHSVIVPRLVFDEQKNKVISGMTYADCTVVIDTSQEQGLEPGSDVILTAFDGVTSATMTGDSDIQARRLWSELLMHTPTDISKDGDTLADFIISCNKAFCERTGDEKQLIGTVAAARVTKRENGGRSVEVATVGDAKAAVVWVDAQGELHTVVVENPINGMIDEVTADYTHAAIMSRDNYYVELAKQFRRNSYKDKTNRGKGSVGVIGNADLKIENIATAEIEIPADAQFFRVITYTDGIDLYAKSLEIPSWVCALLFEIGVDSKKNGFATFGPRNSENSLFFGVSPFGIAAVHAIYALMHPDAYPMDAESRGKWDDAGCVSYGDKIDLLFDIIQKKYVQLKPRVTVGSYKAEREKIRQWFRTRVQEFGKNVPIVGKKKRKRR